VVQWIDPTETDRETWAGPSARRPGVRSVYERAHETTLPYERRESLALAGPDVAEEFDTRAYDRVKLHYSVGVDVDGRVKLLSKGHLWGDEETHQRFRTQYRRPPEPTDIPPFEEYSVWMRFQRGTVHRDDDGTISFEPDPTETEEQTLTLAWPDLYSTDQMRIAEAELVRNPPLARYALDSLGLWDDVRDVFRYKPDAFDRGP
jgi:hypothetical protein